MLDTSFTIVITTYNRYQYLIRLLSFLDNYEQDFSILILDSSSQGADQKIQSKIRNNRRIEYLRYDPDIFISQKIGVGVQHIKTPYAVLCADDDFIIPKAASDCIDFLHKNNDYSAATGYSIVHDSEKTKLSKDLIWSPSTYTFSSIEYRTANRRLKKILRNYNLPTFYAVTRSEILKKIWKEASKNTHDWGLSEMLPMCLTYIEGKVKVLPVLYSSREGNKYRWIDEKVLTRIYSNEKLKPVVKCISDNLVQKEECKIADAKSLVNEHLNLYIKNVRSAFKKTETNNKICVVSKLLNKGAAIFWNLNNPDIPFFERVNINNLRKRYQRKSKEKTIRNKIYGSYRDDYNIIINCIISNETAVEAIYSSRKQYK